VAIPKFTDVKNTAEATTNIGEKVGLAKECAVYLAAGKVGTAPSGCTEGPVTFTATWTGAVSNLKCLTATATAAGSSASITVSAEGNMECAFVAPAS